MDYVSVEAFKSSVSLSGQTFADADVDMALAAASRAVEQATRRKRFDVDTLPVVRRYTATNSCRVMIDDCADVQSVTVSGGDVADFLPEPLNANEDGRPFTWISSAAGGFTTGLRGAVEVTGLWGWPEVPDEVPQMVTILASRLLQRSRQAPFGVLTAGAIEGIAVNLARTDPEMQTLCAPLTRQLVGWR